MKKLKLAVEDLAIESFDTVAAGGLQRGTVLGRNSHENCSANCTAAYSCYCSGDCNDPDPDPPVTWTADPGDTRCCYTWALDARCADSMMTSPGECVCWPAG